MLFVFEKSLLHFLLLVMLFAHAAKRSKTVVHRYSFKQLFLKISQYSQENTYVGAAF